MSAWGSGKTLAEQLREQKREHELQRQRDREKKAQKMESVDEVSSPINPVQILKKKTEPISQQQSQPPVAMQPKSKQLVMCVSLPAHWAESISDKYRFSGHSATVNIPTDSKVNKVQSNPPVAPKAISEVSQSRDSGIAVVGSSSLDATPSSHRGSSHAMNPSLGHHDHRHNPHQHLHHAAHHHHDHFFGANHAHHHHHHHHHYYRGHHHHHQPFDPYNQEALVNTLPHPVGSHPGNYIAGGSFGSIPMAYHHRQHSPHNQNSYFHPMMYEQIPVPHHSNYQRGGGSDFYAPHQYPRMHAFVDRPSYTPSHHQHHHHGHNPNFYPPQ